MAAATLGGRGETKLKNKISYGFPAKTLILTINDHVSGPDCQIIDTEIKKAVMRMNSLLSGEKIQYAIFIHNPGSTTEHQKLQSLINHDYKL